MDPALTWYIESLRGSYCAKERQKPARQNPKVCVHFERMCRDQECKSVEGRGIKRVKGPKVPLSCNLQMLFPCVV